MAQLIPITSSNQFILEFNTKCRKNFVEFIKFYMKWYRTIMCKHHFLKRKLIFEIYVYYKCNIITNKSILMLNFYSMKQNSFKMRVNKSKYRINQNFETYILPE